MSATHQQTESEQEDAPGQMEKWNIKISSTPTEEP
jgi:hypothetical protein